MNLKDLENKARELRKKVIDLCIEKGDAHLGGSLSEIEILVYLYEVVMKPEDKFILSKGHCPYPMYILLREKGYNPRITSHPDIDVNNGIYCTTGSLGHGFPMGVGMALARKLISKNGKIYVLAGDGECEEGTIWESALIAVKHKLDNLKLIIDHNHLQALEGLVLPLDNLKEKFEVFGWEGIEIDGHNFKELQYAFKKKIYKKPKVIVAHTVKGKGISYMENQPKWHARMPDSDEIIQAYRELK